MSTRTRAIGMRWLGAAPLVGAILVTVGCASAPVQTVTTPTPPGRLDAAAFVAFGDSLTQGFVQRCPGTPEDPTQPFPLAGNSSGRGGDAPATAYPARLQAALRARYGNPSIVVVNEGFGGETSGRGVSELPLVLDRDRPEVLLLQEGINDVNARHAAGIPGLVAALRSMVRTAQDRGVRVFVGTLLPQRRGGCRAYDYSDGVDDIVPANVEIRRMVGEEGAMLVDLYLGFVGHTAVFLGEDGLHPSEAGYQQMTDMFLSAIRRRLEAGADVSTPVRPE